MSDQPPKTIDTVKDAYRFLFQNFDHLFKIFLPLSPAFAAVSLVTYLMQGAPLIEHPEKTYSILILCGFFSLPFFAAFAIAIHRAVLQGPSQNNMVNLMKTTKTERSYLLICAALFIAVPLFSMILFFLSMTLPAGLGLMTATIALFLGVWISFRILIYFPAKAIGADMTFKDAFAYSRGLPLKIFFSTLLSSLPIIAVKIIGTILVGILIGLFGSVLGTLSLDLSPLAGKVFILALTLPVLMVDYAATALSVIILSFYYQWAIKGK